MPTSPAVGKPVECLTTHPLPIWCGTSKPVDIPSRLYSAAQKDSSQPGGHRSPPEGATCSCLGRGAISPGPRGQRQSHLQNAPFAVSPAGTPLTIACVSSRRFTDLSPSDSCFSGFSCRPTTFTLLVDRGEFSADFYQTGVGAVLACSLALGLGGRDAVQRYLVERTDLPAKRRRRSGSTCRFHPPIRITPPSGWRRARTPACRRRCTPPRLRWGQSSGPTHPGSRGSPGRLAPRWCRPHVPP